MVAQVRRDIADAQAAVGFDRRRAAIKARGAVLDRRHGAHILVGGSKLIQRIIGVGADRQRVKARDQRTARELAVLRRHRPFALRQARGDKLLGDIACVRRKFETLRQRHFGRGKLMAVREDAADLFQQRDLVVDRVGRHRRHEIERAAPLVDGLVDLALSFKAGAQVDAGRSKVRLQGERRAQLGLTALFVTDLLQQGRAVEVRDEQQRMRLVEGNPDLIKLPRLIRLEPAGRREQFLERQSASRDFLDRGEKRGLRHRRPPGQRVALRRTPGHSRASGLDFVAQQKVNWSVPAVKALRIPAKTGCLAPCPCGERQALSVIRPTWRPGRPRAAGR